MHLKHGEIANWSVSKDCCQGTRGAYKQGQKTQRRCCNPSTYLYWQSGSSYDSTNIHRIGPLRLQAIREQRYWFIFRQETEYSDECLSIGGNVNFIEGVLKWLLPRWLLQGRLQRVSNETWWIVKHHHHLDFMWDICRNMSEGHFAIRRSPNRVLLLRFWLSMVFLPWTDGLYQDESPAAMLVE
jgi:hypothetical protein